MVTVLPNPRLENVEEEKKGLMGINDRADSYEKWILKNVGYYSVSNGSFSCNKTR